VSRLRAFRVRPDSVRVDSVLARTDTREQARSWIERNVPAGPTRVDAYLREGYCWVVVGSQQKDRGLKAGLDDARAYYARLDSESERTVVFSPYDAGAKPVEYDSELSFNYLPAAYNRPGPLVEIHRLRDCPRDRQ
jgi:hypothetical protein